MSKSRHNSINAQAAYLNETKFNLTPKPKHSLNSSVTGGLQYNVALHDDFEWISSLGVGPTASYLGTGIHYYFPFFKTHLPDIRSTTQAALVPVLLIYIGISAILEVSNARLFLGPNLAFWMQDNKNLGFGVGLQTGLRFQISRQLHLDTSFAYRPVTDSLWGWRDKKKEYLTNLQTWFGVGYAFTLSPKELDDRNLK